MKQAPDVIHVMTERVTNIHKQKNIKIRIIMLGCF